MGALEPIRHPNRFQLAIVLLVGISGGFVTLSVGASLAAVAVATVLGLFLGALCSVYLTWIAPTRDVPPRRERR